MSEFDLIQKYFAPLSRDGLQDDAAIIEIPPGHELVVSSDTLNEGVHFLSGTAPGDIARKALRVNLSDLASCGARPLCYQLNIAFPLKPDESWMAAFSAALAADQAAYGIYCSGGDTTSIKGEGVSISITVMGVVPAGKAVRRMGARDGDLLVLSGSTGDAVLGLKALQEGLDYPEAARRYRVPMPRVGIEDLLQNYVHGAADVSDGLLADALKIGQASGLGVEIDLEAIMFSDEVRKAIVCGDLSYEAAVKGGDDYELVMAVSCDNLDAVIGGLRTHGLQPYVIGRFSSDITGLSLKNSGSQKIDVSRLGWDHF